ncbi:MAG: hypothetical protein B6D59_07735 [Campylobacteraceae bacterium 4484_4]|nr:MAG: hypothetical protein B6D59_07735 [Campylobacteraceae bacterium 4484_4]
MIEAHLFRKSLKDFLSPSFLSLSIIPFLITFALFGFLYLGYGSDLLHTVTESIDRGVFPFIDPESHPWLTWLLTFSVFKWLFAIFYYLVGAVLVIMLSVVIAVIVIGFFTPAIVKLVHKKHYPDFVIKNGNFSFISSIGMYLKIFGTFILLLLVALPFMFVPAVNFIAINLPFYYLFHAFLLLDVGSEIDSKEEFKTVIKTYKGSFRTTTLTLYGISLIPLAAIFLQVWFVTLLAHLFFTKTIQARREGLV